MPDLGKGLIILGSVLLAAGLLLLFSDKISFLGKLPGDIVLRRKNVTFYFPLATSILLSVLLSIILYLISRFR